MNSCRVGFDGLAAWTCREREIVIHDFTPQPGDVLRLVKELLLAGLRLFEFELTSPSGNMTARISEITGQCRPSLSQSYAMRSGCRDIIASACERSTWPNEQARAEWLKILKIGLER